MLENSGTRANVCIPQICSNAGTVAAALRARSGSARAALCLYRASTRLELSVIDPIIGYMQFPNTPSTSDERNIRHARYHMKIFIRLDVASAKNKTNIIKNQRIAFASVVHAALCFLNLREVR